MPTELNPTKPVKRRIGALVVEIHADGLLVRGHHKRLKYKAPWEVVVRAIVAHQGVPGKGLTKEEWDNVRRVITGKWRKR